MVPTSPRQRCIAQRRDHRLGWCVLVSASYRASRFLRVHGGPALWARPTFCRLVRPPRARARATLLGRPGCFSGWTLWETRKAEPRHPERVEDVEARRSRRPATARRQMAPRHAGPEDVTTRRVDWRGERPESTGPLCGDGGAVAAWSGPGPVLSEGPRAAARGPSSGGPRWTRKGLRGPTPGAAPGSAGGDAIGDP
jgi:hypothetical protein